MTPRLSLFTIALLLCVTVPANPITGLLQRIDPGAEKKFIVRCQPDSVNYFALSQQGSKVVVTGDSYVSLAVGINWYLKYYAGIHLAWNNMHPHLPEVLPPVTTPERHSTSYALRYDFNYCTFSYSMAFWDWSRWEEELDWMALHGITLPLAAVGQECVWREMLRQLGYTDDEIGAFIAGPAFLAWWAMNNLEGWGGPLPDTWYTQQEALQKKILARMREFGMQPVLPGYAGMLPHDAAEKLGVDVIDSGLWNGFQRPTFLVPTDPHFATIAKLYYDVQSQLFGTANYYSFDPFHEASTLNDVDLSAAAQALLTAMKNGNSDAVWVVQGWTENPRQELLDAIAPGDLLVLDLFSECRPMWGMPSLWQRQDGYGAHPWLFCMLENFGANVGLHGRMDQLLHNYYLTRTHPLASNMQGIGLTMEGIENNPVMFELFCELPWREETITKEAWIEQYLFARYGTTNATLSQAWAILINSIYNCPVGNNQQGPHESIFCARPALNSFQASSWSKMDNYYEPAATQQAAALFLSVADEFTGNNNFEYDLIDIVRQAIADHARTVYNRAIAEYKSFNRQAFADYADDFLRLILLQDSLLATREEFRLGHYTQQALAKATNDSERRQYEWNARVQITTWGNRPCADDGGLRDYAHKEWCGLLADFYYPRWQAFFTMLRATLHGEPWQDIDFYAMEEPWTTDTTYYSPTPVGDPIATAQRVFNDIFP